MITNEKLPDMQKSQQGFDKLKIEKVGVRGIKCPMYILMPDGSKQSVIANVSSYCNLVESVKGINMSRISRTIVDILENSDDGIYDLSTFAKKLQLAHQTDNIYIKATFKYVMKGWSPMTHEISYEPFDITFESTLFEDRQHNYLTVKATGMSLCPCSKEMSLLSNNLTESELAVVKSLPTELQTKILMAGFGAHNQNSLVDVKIETNPKSFKKIWIEDLVQFINTSVSSPVFNTLKRADEKYVTELSYLGGYFDDNKQFIDKKIGGAKFVEDIVRSVASKLEVLLADESIYDYVVVVDNAESIHPEDIYATAIASAGRNLK